MSFIKDLIASITGQQEQKDEVQQLQEKLGKLAIKDDPTATGIFYDDRMLLHKEKHHPECPERYVRTHTNMVSNNIC